MSDNVAKVPLNPEGALELGLWPCTYCNAGWGVISTNERKSCSDTCQYIRRASKAMVENSNVAQQTNGGASLNG